MMRSANVLGAIATLTLLGMTGCASGPQQAGLPVHTRSIPRYAWNGLQPALSIMDHRDKDIDSFSATCRLLLRHDEDLVELNGVLIAKPPEFLRLRAWKFSRAVLDITLNPDGLFVFENTSRDVETMRDKRLTRDGLIHGATLLPGFSAGSNWSGSETATNGQFIRRRISQNPSGAVTCTVDNSTLTAIRCEFLDDRGVARQSLVLEDYRAVDSVVWPMHLIGSGSKGSFEVLFDHVEINPELPPRAFSPPRNAKQLP